MEFHRATLLIDSHKFGETLSQGCSLSILPAPLSDVAEEAEEEMLSES
jgi:hypothetical protein